MLLVSWCLLWAWPPGLQGLLGLVQDLRDRLVPTPVLGFNGAIELTQDVLCLDSPVTMATCKKKTDRGSSY